MEVKPAIRRYRRFPIIIRAISYILVAAFLFQDIVWAYPDLTDQNLAVTGLQNKETRDRMAALYAGKADAKANPLPASGPDAEIQTDQRVTFIERAAKLLFAVFMPDVREFAAVDVQKLDPMEDADQLATYLYTLDKQYRSLTGTRNPIKRLALNMWDRIERETKFTEPLFGVLFKSLIRDFSDADEFVNRCRRIIKKRGAYALKKRLEKARPDDILIKAFQKIKAGGSTKAASIGFYGVLFSYLDCDADKCLTHIYREFMKARPIEEMAIAKRGVSYHARGDAIVHLYPQSLIFKGTDSNIYHSLSPRYGEQKLVDDTVSSDNDKVREAIRVWRSLCPDLKDRIDDFEKRSSVVALKMRTTLLFSDPDNNVAKLAHSGRRRRTLYISKNLMDRLDINIPSNMAVLALLFNRHQRFLEIHDSMMNDGATPAEIQKEILDFDLGFFKISGQSGIALINDIRSRIAALMERDFLIKYKYLLKTAVGEMEKTDADIERFREIVSSPGADIYNKASGIIDLKPLTSALASYRRSMYRLKGMGLYALADMAYKNMRTTVTWIQSSDYGRHPCRLQEELTFTSLRFGKWSDFIEDLTALLTTKGWPRMLTKGEIAILDGLLTPASLDPHSFESEIRHTIAAQIEASGSPELKEIAEKAYALLDEFFKNRFGHLKPGVDYEGDVCAISPRPVETGTHGSAADSPSEALSRVGRFVDAIKMGIFHRGNIVDLRKLPPDVEIALVGDLHGRVDSLEKILGYRPGDTEPSLLEKVKDKKAVLVILGDAVHNDPKVDRSKDRRLEAKKFEDMGPSIEIMRLIMELKTENPDNVYYILGNHDLIDVSLKKGGVDQALLYGDELFRRYGEEYLDVYGEFIKSSEVLLVAKGLVAAHAGPIKDADLKEIRNLPKSDDRIIAALDGRHESCKKMHDADEGRSYYSSGDIGELLGIVGEPNAIFVAAHMPELLYENSFFGKIAERQYVIYAAGDVTGYASFRKSRLNFVRVFPQPPELGRFDAPKPSPQPVSPQGSPPKGRTDHTDRNVLIKDGGQIGRDLNRIKSVIFGVWDEEFFTALRILHNMRPPDFIKISLSLAREEPTLEKGNSAGEFRLYLAAKNWSAEEALRQIKDKIMSEYRVKFPAPASPPHAREPNMGPDMTGLDGPDPWNPPAPDGAAGAAEKRSAPSDIERLLRKKRKIRSEWVELFRLLAATLSQGAKPTPKNISGASGNELTVPVIYSALWRRSIAYEEAGMAREVAEQKSKEECAGILKGLVKKLPEGTIPTPRNIASASDGEYTMEDVHSIFSHHQIAYEEVGMVREVSLPSTRDEWISLFQSLAAQLPEGADPTPLNLSNICHGTLTAQQIRMALYNNKIAHREVGMIAAKRTYRDFMSLAQLGMTAHWENIGGLDRIIAGRERMGLADMGEEAWIGSLLKAINDLPAKEKATACAILQYLELDRESSVTDIRHLSETIGISAEDIDRTLALLREAFQITQPLPQAAPLDPAPDSSAGIQPMIQPSAGLNYDNIKIALASMKPCPWRSLYSMGEGGILSFTGNISSSGSFIDLLNAAAPVLAENIEKLQSHSPISNDLTWAIRDLGTSSHSIMAAKNCPFASVRNVTDDIVLIDFAWIKILRRYLDDGRFGGVVKWLISERLFHEVFHANTETNQTIRDIYYQSLITPELQIEIDAFFDLPDVKKSGIAQKTKARFKFLARQAGYIKEGGPVYMPGIKAFVGIFDAPIKLEETAFQPMAVPQTPEPAPDKPQRPVLRSGSAKIPERILPNSPYSNRKLKARMTKAISMTKARAERIWVNIWANIPDDGKMVSIGSIIRRDIRQIRSENSTEDRRLAARHIVKDIAVCLALKEHSGEVDVSLLEDYRKAVVSLLAIYVPGIHRDLDGFVKDKNFFRKAFACLSYPDGASARSDDDLRGFEEDALETLRRDESKAAELNHRAWGLYKMEIVPAFSRASIDAANENYGPKALKDIWDAACRAYKLLYDISPESAYPKEDFVCAAQEWCRNALYHGGGGIVTIRIIEREGKPAGIEIVALDKGGGISDINRRVKESQVAKRLNTRTGKGFHNTMETAFGKFGEWAIETKVGEEGKVFKYDPAKKEFIEDKAAVCGVAQGTRVRLTLMKKDAADSDINNYFTELAGSYLRFWQIPWERYSSFEPIRGAFRFYVGGSDRYTDNPKSGWSPRILPPEISLGRKMIDVRETYGVKVAVKETEKTAIGSKGHSFCTSYIAMGLDEKNNKILLQGHFVHSLGVNLDKTDKSLIRLLQKITNGLHEVRIVLSPISVKNYDSAEAIRQNLGAHVKTVSVFPHSGLISAFSSERGVAFLSAGPVGRLFVRRWPDLTTDTINLAELPVSASIPMGTADKPAGAEGVERFLELTPNIDADALNKFLKSDEGFKEAYEAGWDSEKLYIYLKDILKNGLLPPDVKILIACLPNAAALLTASDDGKKLTINLGYKRFSADMTMKCVPYSMSHESIHFILCRNGFSDIDLKNATESPENSDAKKIAELLLKYLDMLGVDVIYYNVLIEIVTDALTASLFPQNVASAYPVFDKIRWENLDKYPNTYQNLVYRGLTAEMFSKIPYLSEPEKKQLEEHAEGYYGRALTVIGDRGKHEQILRHLREFYRIFYEGDILGIKAKVISGNIYDTAAGPAADVKKLYDYRTGPNMGPDSPGLDMEVPFRSPKPAQAADAEAVKNAGAEPQDPSLKIVKTGQKAVAVISPLDKLIIHVLGRDRGLLDKLFASQKRIARKVTELILHAPAPEQHQLAQDLLIRVAEIEQGAISRDRRLDEITLLVYDYLVLFVSRRRFMAQGLSALLSPQIARLEKAVSVFLPATAGILEFTSPWAKELYGRGNYREALFQEAYFLGNMTGVERSSGGDRGVVAMLKASGIANDLMALGLYRGGTILGPPLVFFDNPEKYGLGMTQDVFDKEVARFTRLHSWLPDARSLANAIINIRSLCVGDPEKWKPLLESSIRLLTERGRPDLCDPNLTHLDLSCADGSATPQSIQAGRAARQMAPVQSDAPSVQPETVKQPEVPDAVRTDSSAQVESVPVAESPAAPKTGPTTQSMRDDQMLRRASPPAIDADIQNAANLKTTLDKFYEVDADKFIYTISLDAKRIPAEYIKLIKEHYAKILSSDKVEVKVIGNNKMEESGKLIKVEIRKKGKDEIEGEGVVDIKGGEGGIGSLGRLVGMINLAISVATLPEELPDSGVNTYRSILDSIFIQYQSLTGEKLVLPAKPEEILAFVRKIAQSLPPAKAYGTEPQEEFRIMEEKLSSAA